MYLKKKEDEERGGTSVLRSALTTVLVTWIPAYDVGNSRSGARPTVE